MESNIIHYLILVSKLRDIIQYIDNHFPENDIKSYILECKNLCIEKLKHESLINILIEELSSQKHEETTQTDTIETDTTQIDTTQIDPQPDETNIISSITNLLGGPQEFSINDFDPSSFDNIGNGLSRLFKINTQAPSPSISIQQPSNFNLIKNEIKNTNKVNNLTYQIKKKI